MVFQINAVLRKVLGSGKGGEANVKVVPEGGFLGPDTIAEGLKILEDVIVQLGQRDSMRIGCAFQGDAMWQADKLKYEVEGAKQLFDTDQMVNLLIKIDFYYKLCVDKPLISYLEEPLLSTDAAGYQKLLDKLTSTHAKLSSKKVVDNKLNVNVQFALYRYQDFKTFSSLCEQWKSLTFKVLFLFIGKSYLAHIRGQF